MLDLVPRRARLSTNSVATSAAVVAVAMFGLGFFAAYEPGSNGEPSAASPTSDPPASATTTSSIPATTDTTLVPTSAGPTTAPPTTVLPTTALPLPTTTATVASTPTTVRPTTTTRPEPGHLVINYPHNVDGQMTMVEGGTAALVLINDGGEALSFRIDSAGAVVVGANGSASGALFPNETLSVPVVAERGVDGPGPHGTIAEFTNVGLVTNIQVTVT
jgi:hypothetical protein